MASPPISPRLEVGGFVYFARMLDKIRRHARGELHPDFHANLGRGFDLRCCRYLRVDYEALKARVLAGGTDEEIFAWCQQTGRPLSTEDIYVWNQFMLKRGDRDEATPMLEKYKAWPDATTSGPSSISSTPTKAAPDPMPLTPTATRGLLAQLGLRPRRDLGQNFLVDGNIVRKSLDMAGIRPGDAVVEIGPGLGTLTGALLEAGAEAWAIEMDRTLFEHLRTGLATAHPGFHLREGDAVELPLAGLPAERSADFKIVANLPYAISTPWMDAVLGGPLPRLMVLMLQLEAAQRFMARPGTKQFGAISIFLQAAYAVAAEHRVAAACFHPRPEVESCLLQLERREQPFVFTPAAKGVVRRCFQQRRKQIGALLRPLLPDAGRAWLEQLAAAGLSARARPEEIPVALWQGLQVQGSARGLK
jgi:16S rRNA (adenine1518-N6/adenine1519-N6)-dimethyltransferase